MPRGKVGQPTKIKTDQIPLIVEMVKHRMTQTDMALALGLHRNTIRNWLLRGETEKAEGKKNLFCQLYDAVNAAKSVLVQEYAGIVRKSITEGYEEQTTKISQFRPDGSKVEIITKKPVPNVAYALKMLAQMRPEEYADVQHLKIDYRESLQKRGLDPAQIEKDYFEYLERNKGELPIPIPLIPENTV